MLGGDAGAIVGDLDDGAIASRALARMGGGGLLRGDADGDCALGACGLGGVGDEVGEDLAQFGGEAFDDDAGGEFGRDR